MESSRMCISDVTGTAADTAGTDTCMGSIYMDISGMEGILGY